MICFASIVSSSPLLIPTINQENILQIQETIHALEKIAILAAETDPETLIIISLNDENSENMFSINLSEEYLADFKNFGDLITKMKFKSDAELIYKIKERFENLSSPLSTIITTEPNLSINNSVPLYYLKQKIQKFSLIPINCSSADQKTHLLFGQNLKEEISSSNKRVAIIACHKLLLKKEASDNKNIEESLINLIKKKNIAKLIKQDVYDLRPILVFLGIIHNLKSKPKILSWQKLSDFGYLTINFDLNFKKQKFIKVA